MGDPGGRIAVTTPGRRRVPFVVLTSASEEIGAGGSRTGSIGVSSTSRSFTLRLPMAQNEQGQLVSPEEGTRDAIYFCPACHAPVILRSGPIRVRHFAHKPDLGCPLSQGESWNHWWAKHLIAQVVESRPREVRIQRTCDECGDSTIQPLPPGVNGAQVEYTLANGLRADVALLANGQPVCLVEVRQTHAVGKEKAGIIDLPWMEVMAADILIDPSLWVVVQGGRLKPWRCRGRAAREQGQIMPLVQHGLATHTVVCPERYRVWRGKSYANYIDDCTGCRYHVLFSQEGQEGAKTPVRPLSPEPESYPRYFSCSSPAWDRLSDAEQRRYHFFLRHPDRWGRAERNRYSQPHSQGFF